MNPKTLSLPVGYTLISQPDGSFIAVWQPAVPTKDLPTKVRTTSRTSGIHALERLYDELIEKGVVRL